MVIDPKTALRVERRGNNIEYVFPCADCSKEITRRLDFLKANDAVGLCRACANKDNWWKTRLRPYEYILTNLRCQHRYSGVLVELSYEDLLFFIGHSQCTYCEKTLVWLERQTKKSGGSTNLDRKDSRLGYSKSNCVACCWECNRIKGNVYTYEEMRVIGRFLKSFRETRGNSVLR